MRLSPLLRPLRASASASCCVAAVSELFARLKALEAGQHEQHAG